MAKCRDDFTKPTIKLLRERVNNTCSNPTCRISTLGPNSLKAKTTSVGNAAHITAASKGGPRYDSSLTSEQRKSYDNGIWLCGVHAKEIDVDVIKYPVQLLKEWKRKAIERASNNFGKSMLSLHEVESQTTKRIVEFAMNHNPQSFVPKLSCILKEYDNELENLDSRFTVKTKIENSKTSHTITSKDKPVCLSVNVSAKHLNEMDSLFKRGTQISVPVEDVNIRGSLLFDHIQETYGSNGHLNISMIPERVEFELIVVNVFGEFTVGTFSGDMYQGSDITTMEGVGLGGFVKVNVELEGPSTSLTYRFITDAWEGKDIMKIPYFPKLKKAWKEIFRDGRFVLDVSWKHQEPVRLDDIQPDKMDVLTGYYLYNVQYLSLINI